MSKKVLLSWMHELLVHNVLGDKQYNNRYNGFNGELHFMKWFRSDKGCPTAPGGMFIPSSKTDDSFRDALYILPASLDEQDFIYEQLRFAARLASKGVFLIRFNANEPLKDWAKLLVCSSHGQAPVYYPSSLKIYRLRCESDDFEEISLAKFSSLSGFRPSFSKKARVPEKLKLHFIEKLGRHEYRDIVDLYVSRFALDVLCSTKNPQGIPQRGAPLDIDLFSYSKKDEWSIIEVKEKNLSQNGCFGMDIRRINSLFKLCKCFSAPAYYFVRHINNQTERNFVGWKAISMRKFDREASGNNVRGGTGMMSVNANVPTRLCRVVHFEEQS